MRDDGRVEISAELVFWSLIGLIALLGGVGVIAGLFGLYRPKG